MSAEVRITTLRLARRLRQEKADDELSVSQTGVLIHLDHNGTQTPAALSASEQVSPPSMNRTLNTLQKAGYIERTPSEVDRRMVIVSLTDAGRNIVLETRRRRDAWLDRRLETLTAPERKLLEQAATIIRKLIEQ